MKYRILITIILFLVLGLPLSGQQKQERETLIFVSGAEEGSIVEKIILAVYGEVFGRLGVDFEYRYYPFERAAYLLQQGEVDGDLGRTISFDERYPGFLKSTVPAYSDSFVAFSTDPSIDLPGWDSLANAPYKIDYNQGFYLLKTNLTQMGIIDRMVPITTDEQGLRRLVNGLSEVYLSSEYFVKTILYQSSQYDNVIISGIQEQVDLYGYFLPGHKDLVKELDVVLQDMKREGFLQQIQEDVLNNPDKYDR